jgi:hypothetical protein
LHAAAAAQRSPALSVGAAEDLIGGHADHSRHDFGEREVLAVALFPHVGGEQLIGFGGGVHAGIELEFERGRETFTARIVRLAGNDQRNDRAFGVARFEGANLLADVVALGRGGRADHDQSR